MLIKKQVKADENVLIWFLPKNIKIGRYLKIKKGVIELCGFGGFLMDSLKFMQPVLLGIWSLHGCSVLPGFPVKEVPRCLLCVRRCYGLKVCSGVSVRLLTLWGSLLVRDD